MKVLTLYEPWATLVVIGAKKIETRPFNTKIKQRVLIHTSLQEPAESVLKNPYFSEALKGREYFQLGKIIGMVSIGDTFNTENADQFFLDNAEHLYDKQDSGTNSFPLLVQREKAFGDYSPGRFGWKLSDPGAFTNFTPFQGGVGFTKSFDEQICMVCGCTDDNCPACIEKTGFACYWVERNLCSACKKK